MKILSLILNGFRGFTNANLDFGKRVTILTGINGSGKSSLLDAISLNINHGIHRLTADSPSSYGPEHFLENNDINNAALKCSIKVIYELNGTQTGYLIGKYINDSFSTFEGDDFIAYFKSIKEHLTSSTNLPIAVYYNTSKSFNEDHTNKTILFPFKQLNAYINASNKNTFSFNSFSKWFREEEDIENEVRLRQDSNYKSPGLNLVRNILVNFFNAMGKDAYTDLTIIRAKPINIENFNFEIKSGGELFIKKNGNYLKLAQLSDGEKSLLLMVVDLAGRLAQLNPSLSDPSMNSEGFVLIDEIEQHLHPSWQRKAVPALLKTFPSLQFIVSTHSEHVLMSLLELVETKELDADKMISYFLKPDGNTIKIEKNTVNDEGQIDGGLSGFYYDLINQGDDTLWKL